MLDTLGYAPEHPDQILDHGCGVGGWFDLLPHAYPKAMVYCVDVSSAAIEKAQIRYPGYGFKIFEGMQRPKPSIH